MGSSTINLQLSGLLACRKGDNDVIFTVPLVDSAIHATVRGCSASVICQLTYENQCDESIECLLVVPFDENSAVFKIAVDFAGCKIRGECRSRERAIETHANALDHGYDGTLLDNISTVATAQRLWLGHLKPNEKAIAVIGIVQPLRWSPKQKQYSLLIPSVMNPRYLPELKNKWQDRNWRKDLNLGKDVTFCSVNENAYSIGFEADIFLGIDVPIQSIETISIHDKLKIEFTNDKTQANVSLDGPFEADHDLELRLVPGNQRPLVVFERGYSPSRETEQHGKYRSRWLTHHCAGIWMSPTANGNEQQHLTFLKGNKKVFWFLIDCSHRMEGPRLEETKVAFLFFIKSLPPNCKFNVLTMTNDILTHFSRK